MSKINIAIDGPAGAGKSTIAKMVAKSLGILYIDTGAMYRAVALKAINKGIDTRDHTEMAELAANIHIKVCHIDGEQRIFLDGRDVSGEIRTPEVSRSASEVAAVAAVRLKMVELQREISMESSVVMDGRDIGTFVLPHADFKIFLTASLEERAKRRYSELMEKGCLDMSFTEVLKDIEYRDRNDRNRDFAPLAKAGDAIELDTTNLAIEEVAEKIILLAKSKG